MKEDEQPGEEDHGAGEDREHGGGGHLVPEEEQAAVDRLADAVDRLRGKARVRHLVEHPAEQMVFE